MRSETLLPVGKLDPGLRDTSLRLDLRQVPEMARAAEEIGYDGIASGETKNDPFAPLLLAATSTERVRLTTAVLIAFPRSPTATAMIAWDLQATSNGRFVLGLGPQVKGHIERRYGTSWAKPLPRMRDYVLALRAVWNSWQNRVPLNFHSDHYNLSLMVVLLKYQRLMLKLVIGSVTSKGTFCSFSMAFSTAGSGRFMGPHGPLS
jgi:alkanesulfonate monooxygenase SsuD/methylene tetrahydromethanopterin reductase-like flavin-dependent oxidoreductase (luciferase family)